MKMPTTRPQSRSIVSYIIAHSTKDQEIPAHVHVWKKISPVEDATQFLQFSSGWKIRGNNLHKLCFHMFFVSCGSVFTSRRCSCQDSAHVPTPPEVHGRLVAKKILIFRNLLFLCAVKYDSNLA